MSLPHFSFARHDETQPYGSHVTCACSARQENKRVCHKRPSFRTPRVLRMASLPCSTLVVLQYPRALDACPLIRRQAMPAIARFFCGLVRVTTTAAVEQYFFRVQEIAEKGPIFIF